MLGEQVDLTSVSQSADSTLGEFGASPRGVGWRDAESQELRFEQLIRLFDLGADGPVSVNDLGCGYGAFCSWMIGRAIPIDRFSGYDISNEMIRAAREHVRDPRADFILSDRVLHDADYSFASGTFYEKLKHPEAEWARYVESMLFNLFEHSRRGFAFNMLSTYVDYREDDLFYADPREYFDFCKRNFSPHVSVLHDYPLWEWTMVVRRR